jgi:hypothetical protein
MTCISEPVSWLRLERYALDGRDGSVREHIAACPACKSCLDEIARDAVVLRPLIVPEKRRWWLVAIPAFAVAAAILFLLRPREETSESVRIKGLGTVELDVIRERNGAIGDDRTFRAGDRFKVIVTCPPEHLARFDVAVTEQGAARADRPLAPAQLLCGNRVVLPGAFSLTGNKPHRVCVRINDAGDACLTLRPEN